MANTPGILNHKNAIFAGILAILNSSCALYGVGQNNASVVTTCTLPTDQVGTLSGHWSTTPVPISFHQGDFGTSEISAITAAADSWNQFFTASQNHDMIKYGTTDSPTTSPIANPAVSGILPCAGQGIIVPGQGSFNGSVVIYKVGRWPTRYPASAMALTSFCFSPAQQTSTTENAYPYFFASIIELNYQYFYSAGLKQPDIQTILLHELGHVVGLDHTCEYQTKKGFPNCNDASLNPEYVAASMFPTFNFDGTGAGQQKRSLARNDQGRANCLYKSSSSGTSPSPNATQK